MIDDTIVTRAISQRFFEKFQSAVELDAAIVGGGPSGLVAGAYLARAGKNVALFESKLCVGGGLWGGGMLFNEIVVQEEAREMLDDFGITHRPFSDGYYTADSVHAVMALGYRATRDGLRIFNAMKVEDVMFRDNRVCGVVLSWSPVAAAGLHVDPLSMRAHAVLDATGHPAEIAHLTIRKMGVTLRTETGQIMGERSMWAERGEQSVVEYTGEVFPGLYVSGMAACAVHGGYRMGPIFGGMLRSGRRAAELILADLNGEAPRSHAHAGKKRGAP